MTTVSVLYLSGSGHTAKMAEAVAKGAAASGAKVNLLPIRGEDINHGRYQNDSVSGSNPRPQWQLAGSAVTVIAATDAG